MRRLMVDLGERSYPIVIGEGIWNLLPGELEARGIRPTSPLLVVTDDRVASLYLETVTGLLASAGYRVAAHVVPAGEPSKSLTELEKIVTSALRNGLDRSSTILALGGGVVGDLAGFAAACYMRGIRYVQLPTTILAHDSSVGGKVAVNHPLAKNVIGAFHQPEFVFYELSTLRTLPLREVRAGLAEIIKEAMIWDASFLDWCEAHAERLLALDAAALEYALARGCEIKAEIVSRDEREEGLRALLNFGHTIGHALETVTGYGEWLHGEAVAIGMVGEALLAVRLGYPEEVYRTTRRIVEKFGLPVAFPVTCDADAVVEAMKRDKKFREGRAVFALPVAVGRVEIVRDVPLERVRETIEELKKGVS